MRMVVKVKPVVKARLCCASVGWLLLILLAMPPNAARFACAEDKVLLTTEVTLDFNRDVRPILSEHCFACHGFDEKARQADLRLDVSESAYEKRGESAAVVPGKPESSELWRRINAKDDTVMPPEKTHLTLSEAQKETLKKWVEQGAIYAGHWSFIAPRKVDIPQTEQQKQSQAGVSSPRPNPIDAFVDQRLRVAGLQRSPRADRATLMRRVSLDLTGLAPSAADVRAFVSDQSPDAYARLVDRLLMSPHFGERMALDWLDAARYADTNGFSIDGGRHMWLWRDWVIQAFNDNKPYDQFLVEQIAGDLLPNATDEQKIATGFQRNNMVTHEGGTIPDENLVNYNADRVKTFGEAVLGLTLGCSQCHDHKFDPISQREYYQIFAFFNSLGDKGLDGNAGVNPAPSIQAKTVLKTDELPTLEKEIADLERLLSERDPQLLLTWENRERKRLASRGKDFKTYPVNLVKVSTPNRGTGFEIDTATNRVRLDNIGGLGAIDVALELPQVDQPIAGLRVIIHPDEGLSGAGWGYGPDDQMKKRAKKDSSEPEAKKENAAKGTFMLTALALSADRVPGDQINLFKLQPIQSVTANSFESAHRPIGCLDPRNESGWSPDPSTDGPVRLTATFADAIDAKATPHVTVQLNFGHGKSLIPKWVELQVFSGTDDDTDLPTAIVKLLETPDSVRSSDQRETLWKYCSENADELHAKRIALANLRERKDVLTQKFTCMVMEVSGKPRETFVLQRGDYSKPGEKVSPGTLRALPPMRPESKADRLGLAEWVVMKENPLTARVAVNRVWKSFFGRGIVGTPADFGSQGEWPTHPELLDWLSVDFVEQGWNVKQLIRTIVLSETYCQTSRCSPELMERDPQNELLARGPRSRLSAEWIRDNALRMSGLLVGRIGGPSVNPYSPGDLWREVSHYGSSPATAQTFVQDHGEKLYRRSIYTYWKRTAPPPNMMAFDAPNREVCTVSRGNTTTPLQALVTLNDVQFVEATRNFAARMMRAHEDDQSRLEWGFLEATSRFPSANEIEILRKRLERERLRYQSDRQRALASLQVGESPQADNLDVAEQAAWGQIASLLLNLSETITKN
jgi:hypothetical protein